MKLKMAVFTFTNFVSVDLLFEEHYVFIFCVVVSQEAWLLGPHTSGFVCALTIIIAGYN